MRHLDDGTLRRMVDEPLAVSQAERRHYEGCVDCAARYTGIAEDAKATAALFSAPLPSVSAAAALSRVEERVDRNPSTSASAPSRRLHQWRPLGLFGAAAAATALVAAIAFTPAGSLAQSFITVFQPKQIALVPVTAAELRSLPNLTKYGTIHAPAHTQPAKVAGIAAAETTSGMHVLIPSSLPSGVPTKVSYQVMPSETGTFTFSAAKARQAVAAAGKPAPSMPTGIDGSTLRLTTGVAVAAVYGSGNGVPALVIGQTRAPKVSSTGVSVKTLENYILSLPGVSPTLARSIRAIGDPTTTLPIPVPVDRTTSQTVQIHGAQGLVIGDSTGLGSAIIWEKDHMIYGVAGTLSRDQILAIAGSLH